MFDLQESGTFQLTYDLTNELPTTGSIASRELFLNGMYRLKLKGGALQGPVFGSTFAFLSTSPCNLQITSPQIRSSLTPSSPGFVLPVELNVGNLSVETHAAPYAGPFQIYTIAQSIVGGVMEHSLIASIQNKLEISVGVANGFNGTSVVYDRDWITKLATVPPVVVTDPVYLILTFEYLRV